MALHLVLSEVLLASSHCTSSEMYQEFERTSGRYVILVRVELDKVLISG